MNSQLLEIPVKGMDCAECASHVQSAIAGLPGVESVNVLLTAEKAVIRMDPARVQMPAIRAAVVGAGYTVPEASEVPANTGADLSKAALNLFGIVFGAVLIVVVFGEGLGWFEALTSRVPFAVGVVLVALAGFPIFRNVVRATLKGQVISHTLMSIGAVAALVIGDWVTAAIVVFFMRVGSYAEQFTTDRSREALKSLTALAPQTARVLRDGHEQELAIGEVRIGDVVVVRPGETIPVDGEVLNGHATVNQATITGESMPVEVGAGTTVFAATIAQLGSLRVRTTRIGADTTFGKVIRLVEEAEGNRAEVQRIADKFSAYYLPVVATIAALTFFFSRDPLATAAVLVVACSCSFALATPIAMLASVGAAAKHGLLIKGGKYIEALARADVVLVDKTGTLTLGQPRITAVVPLNGVSETELLTIAASVERDSEHPLAEAVRAAALAQRLDFQPTLHFEAQPGIGVRAQVQGRWIEVGRADVATEQDLPAIATLEAQGNTTLVVRRDGQIVGVLGAADTLRADMPQAMADLRSLGIRDIVMLTGDNARVAEAVATPLGITYQAGLLPEDKIRIVQEYQEHGRTVVMVGDGVNDAPALAQAHVGIAMGAAGTDVALDAAHIALMREDWSLVPEAVRLARRTMGIVKMNLGFTVLYNVVGLSLAAFGILPPIFAAAAQSVPDLGILANSSRLLRYTRADTPRAPFHFDLKRWSPLLFALAAVLFVGGIVVQVQLATTPAMGGTWRPVLEGLTTIVLVLAFAGGLGLGFYTRVTTEEEKHGGEIPLPACACCNDDVTPAAQATPVGETALASCACCNDEATPVAQEHAVAASPLISLGDIEIR